MGKDSMRDRTVISTLGLANNNLMSLASMLRLTAELRENYQLGQPNDASADVVFVNADEPSALTALEKFQKVNRCLTPIMVTSNAESASEEVTIARPLVFKRILDALKRVTESPRRTGLEEDTAEAVAAAAASGIKRILVVDDSFPVRKYMEQKIPLLSKAHIELSFAASGEEAMAKVKEESPDLIFLDVMMPGVDGYKVCKWIKSIQPAAHVAMLTSKKSPFDKVRGAMSGCNNYLTKPPEDGKLAKILEEN